MPCHEKFKVAKTSGEAEGITTLEFEQGLSAGPGQFIMIWVPGIDEKPFGVGNDSPLHVTIASRGKFSSHLCSLKKGDSVFIRGPYGNSFDFSKSKSVCIVGGGYGMAPLRFAAKVALAKGVHVTAVQGARTKSLLMKSPACKTTITTDDGSAGIKGTALDGLKLALEQTTPQIDLVCACGPERMMLGVAKLCEAKGIEFQLSVERLMKCGVGLCGHCAVGTKLCCKDGTIFGKEILKEKEFGSSWREKNGASRPL